MILAWEWCHCLCFFAFFFLFWGSWKAGREMRSGALPRESGARGDTAMWDTGVPCCGDAQGGQPGLGTVKVLPLGSPSPKSILYPHLQQRAESFLPFFHHLPFSIPWTGESMDKFLLNLKQKRAKERKILPFGLCKFTPL